MPGQRAAVGSGRRARARARARRPGERHRLGLGREVRQQEQPVAGVLAHEAEDVVVAGPDRPRPPLGVDGAGGAAGGDQPPQPGPQAALDGGRIVAALGRLPVHRRPVHPAVVVAVGGVGLPLVVVAQPELVAHVDQRQAAVGERDRVEQQHAADGELLRELVAALERRLEPGQRRRGPARARVAGARVVLEARAAREGVRELPGVEVGQEAAVQVAVLPDRRRVLLRDRPADVVVAAHVRHPAGAGRHGRHRLQRLRHQRRRAARRASSTAAP